MTDSSLNIQILTDNETFQIWKFQIDILFGAKGLDKIISGKYTKNTENEDKFNEKDAQAKNYIVRTIHRKYITQLFDCVTSKEMYEKICNIFEGSEERKKMTLLQEFYNIKITKELTMEENLANIENLTYRLKQLKVNLEDAMVESKILTSLDETYHNFATAWESTPLEERTLKNLKIRLIKEEERKGQLAGSSNQVALKAHTSSKQKAGIECFICKKPGHFAKDCRSHCRICKKTNHKEKNCYFKKKDNVALAANKNSTVNKNLEHFVVDSGCTVHLVKDKHLLSNIRPNNTEIGTAQKGCNLKAVCEGDYLNTNCSIKNVLCVPDLSRNLLSVSEITKVGGQVIFDRNKVEIRSKDRETITGTQETSGLFTLQLPKNFTEEAFFSKQNEDNTAISWHKKMGHPGQGALRNLVKAADGIKMKNATEEEDRILATCEVCIKAKQTRFPFNTQRKRAQRILEILHTDVCGPFEVETWDKKRYFLTVIDDFSNFTKVYPLRYKNEVPLHIKHYIEETEREKNEKVSTIRCDNGGEYSSKEFQNWCKEKGIKLDYNVPYSPQLNGKSERFNRTLTEKIRCLLYNADVAKEMWGEALYCAVYLLNRLPSESINNLTPFELFNKQKPNLANVREFGTEAYAKVLTQTKKLDSRTEKYMMVGYTNNGYRLWDETRKKIIVARDVIFSGNMAHKNVSKNITDSIELCISGEENEKQENLEAQNSSSEGTTATGNTSQTTEEENVGIQTLENIDVNQNIEIIDSEQESNYESSFTDSEDNQSMEIQPGVATRSGRNIKTPARYNDYALLTFNDVMNAPDKDKWKKAIEDELKSLKDNGVWKLVDKEKAANKNILSNRWVFRVKENGTYKARLVVRGNEQRETDFDDVFSPVASQSAIRSLFAIAAAKNYNFMTFDVKTAFLNGNLREDEEIFMKIPLGVTKESGKICQLVKSLYGLRQSPKRWNEKFLKSMSEVGFTQAKNEPCILKNWNSSIIIGIYVDDGIIIGPNEKGIRRTLQKINSKFEIKICEKPTSFLGMEITQNSIGINLTQTAYAKQILKKYNMEDCKHVTTPCKKDEDSQDTIEKQENKFPYREAVGSLLYLSTKTRPDLAYAVGMASRNMENPDRKDIVAVKRVLRYLAGTLGEGVCYKNNTELELSVFCDSDYAGDVKTRRSTTGYIIMLGGGPVAWCSRRQAIVALSSTESEFIAAAECCKESMFLKSLLFDLNLNISVTFKIDNQSAIQLIKTGIFNKRSKHIDVRYHYIHEVYANNGFKIEYCCTENQTADILTKALDKSKFLRHKSSIIC